MRSVPIFFEQITTSVSSIGATRRAASPAAAAASSAGQKAVTSHNTGIGPRSDSTCIVKVAVVHVDSGVCHSDDGIGNVDGGKNFRLRNTGCKRSGSQNCAACEILGFHTLLHIDVLDADVIHQQRNGTVNLICGAQDFNQSRVDINVGAQGLHELRSRATGVVPALRDEDYDGVACADTALRSHEAAYLSDKRVLGEQF